MTICVISNFHQLTFKLVDLQVTTYTGWHKMCHSTAQNVPHHCTKVKMCHSTAQNVPQHGTNCATARQQNTFRLMCHGNAQNVSYHGTKRLLGKFCFFYIRKKSIIYIKL
jgi:hypothetical protein